MDNREENLAITICSTSVLSLVQSIHSPAIPFVLTGPHKDFTDGGPTSVPVSVLLCLRAMSVEMRKNCSCMLFYCESSQ